ncbi:MAG: recombination protein RecR [Gemmatimonadetes bacterium]|nr:recombination protein RecR [Gemmatimonadota bacterium]
MEPEALARLVEEFARLPGIGRKSARRLAFWVLKADQAGVDRFADALRDVKRKIRFCDTCWDVTEDSPCAICRDARRDESLLCVVEEPSDVLAIEATSEFRGRYHVLHGVLSPLDGVGPDDLKIRELLARVRESAPREVILALNPDTEGDATAYYLQKLLDPVGCIVSRIARGIPVGGDLEFADTVTLSRAIQGRERLHG